MTRRDDMKQTGAPADARPARRSIGIGSAEIGDEGMAAARAALDVPSQAAQCLVLAAEESLRDTVRLLDAMLRSLREATTAAHATTSLQQLALIPWKLGNEQLAQIAVHGATESRRWVDAGTRVFELAPQFAQASAARLQALAPDAAAAEPGTPQDAFERGRQAWDWYARQWAEMARRATMP